MTRTFPKVERRDGLACDGRVRTWVRYDGQSRWYRSLATAQVALQRAERFGGRS
jgi:hypothetical protein